MLLLMLTRPRVTALTATGGSKMRGVEGGGWICRGPRSGEAGSERGGAEYAEEKMVRAVNLNLIVELETYKY